MATKTIKVSEILLDVENGLERKDIKTKYGLTGKEMSLLFKHPSLKSKRAKKITELNIIDDRELAAKINEELAFEDIQPMEDPAIGVDDASVGIIVDNSENPNW